MNTSTLDYVATEVAKGLFNKRRKVIVGKIGKYAIKQLADGNCRSVDIDKYRFVTQNPTKESVSAKRARGGENIMWIFKSGHRGFYAGWFHGKLKMYNQLKHKKGV